MLVKRAKELSKIINKRRDNSVTYPKLYPFLRVSFFLFFKKKSFQFVFPYSNYELEIMGNAPLKVSKSSIIKSNKYLKEDSIEDVQVIFRKLQRQKNTKDIDRKTFVAKIEL